MSGIGRYYRCGGVAGLLVGRVAVDPGGVSLVYHLGITSQHLWLRLARRLARCDDDTGNSECNSKHGT